MYTHTHAVLSLDVILFDVLSPTDSPPDEKCDVTGVMGGPRRGYGRTLTLSNGIPTSVTCSTF